jgi:hypothetical protein
VDACELKLECGRSVESTLKDDVEGRMKGV